LQVRTGSAEAKAVESGNVELPLEEGGKIKIYT
jgi:hypothetical protein